MLKKLSIIALTAVVGSSLAFAAPTAKSETSDLLSVASNGALSQKSENVQKLDKAEMEQVKGGWKIKLPRLCKKCFIKKR